MTDHITLPMPRDPDDAPRIIVDRAFSDDGATLTLWFEEST